MMTSGLPPNLGITREILLVSGADHQTSSHLLSLADVTVGDLGPFMTANHPQAHELVG